jgi:uncharacterized membrane protein
VEIQLLDRAHSAHSLQAAVVHNTVLCCPQRFVKWENIFNPFAGITRIESLSSLENLWALYLQRHNVALLTQFVEMHWMEWHPSLGCEMHCLSIFPVVISICLLHIMCKKIPRWNYNIIVRVHIHSLFCILNVMLPAYRPNFSEFSLPIRNVEPACLRLFLRPDAWIAFVRFRFEKYTLHQS